MRRAAQRQRGPRCGARHGGGILLQRRGSTARKRRTARRWRGKLRGAWHVDRVLLPRCSVQRSARRGAWRDSRGTRGLALVALAARRPTGRRREAQRGACCSGNAAPPAARRLARRQSGAADDALLLSAAAPSAVPAKEEERISTGSGTRDRKCFPRAGDRREREADGGREGGRGRRARVDTAREGRHGPARGGGWGQPKLTWKRCSAFFWSCLLFKGTSPAEVNRLETSINYYI